MTRAGLFAGVFVGLSWAGCVDAQTLGGGSALDISVVRNLAALAICLAAAFALALVVRQRRSGQSILPRVGTIFAASTRIRVIETRRLSQSADVSLLACDGVEYLIVTGNGGCRVLSQREGSRGEPVDAK